MNPQQVLRQGLLGLSRNHAVRSGVERAPVSRDVVRRFVPGEETGQVVDAVRAMRAKNLRATIDYLGEDTLDREQALATRNAYLDLLAELADAELTDGGLAEVSVKLSAIGQSLGADGDNIALHNARVICEAAQLAGTTVTIDMEDHTTTDRTIAAVRELRADFPSVGVVLQAYLKRTEADCREFASAGSRVRLCKGAYDEPASVAFRDKSEVDLSYVRCLRILMEGQGYPMVASHDPRIIEIAGSLAQRNLRDSSSFEYQMLYGIRPKEQQRLADTGATMRVYLPYGEEWYGYLVRRMAERPANTMFFLRGVATKR